MAIRNPYTEQKQLAEREMLYAKQHIRNSSSDNSRNMYQKQYDSAESRYLRKKQQEENWNRTHK